MSKILTRRREFLSLVGAFAAAALPKSVVAQASAPLNFGYQNTSWGTLGMIAEAENMFAKAGATVKVFRFDGGKTTRDAMIAGRVDIGVLGSTPFIVGAAKGDVIGIAMAMYAARTNSIVASAKSGIRSIPGLKGRKVASQLGSATDHVFQDKILPKFGLSKSDVQVINIPHQNHVAAMVSGSVDAFAGVEPFPSIAEVEKLGVVVLDYSGFDLLPVIVAANRSAVDAKRDSVIAFLRGWLAAVQLFKTDQPKAVRIVANHFKGQGFTISDQVVTLMLSKLDVNPEFSPALKDQFDAEAKVLVAEKKIDGVPDWNKLINNDLLRQAAVKA